MDTKSVDQAIDDIYAVLYGNWDLSPANVVSVIGRAMELAAGYKNLTGEEKKKAVIAAVRKMIDKAIPDDVPYIESFLEHSASLAIETLVEVDKGKLRIRRPKSCSFCPGGGSK